MSSYCVECLVEIDENTKDGTCDRCRQYLAAGGPPRQWGGESIKDYAIDLFYPFNISMGRRFWGGYAGFFEPDIPDRLADGFIRNIEYGLWLDDIDALRKAKAFLESEHTKLSSNLQCGVQCKPTEKGLKAAKLLKAVFEEMEEIIA